MAAVSVFFLATVLGFRTVTALTCFSCSGGEKQCQVASNDPSSPVALVVDCGFGEICFTAVGERGCKLKPNGYEKGYYFTNGSLFCNEDLCNNGPIGDLSCYSHDELITSCSCKFPQFCVYGNESSGCGSYRSNEHFKCSESPVECNGTAILPRSMQCCNAAVCSLAYTPITCYQCSQTGPGAEAKCADTNANMVSGYVQLRTCPFHGDICMTRKEFTADGAVASVIRTCIDNYLFSLNTHNCQIQKGNAGQSSCHESCRKDKCNLHELRLKVRLAGSGMKRVGQDSLVSGRVEVYFNGSWGTICHNGWDIPDARVVCKQLGFHDALAAKSSAFYGQGNGTIWLSEVKCIGDEEHLARCKLSFEKTAVCSHESDVGVECDDGSEVRLAVGSEYGSFEGRVEILHDSEWGRVCYLLWGLPDADVVCRQLGFNRSIQATSFPYGQQKIWMARVKCVGTEKTLHSCPFRGWGIRSSRCKEAGVICDRLRLAGGSSYLEGRLEVFNSGEWGTVCNTNWGMKQADVVCHYLGSPGAIKTHNFGPGNGKIWMNNVICSGNETSPLSCSFDEWGNNSCKHAEDVGIVCGSIRLKEGSHAYYGPVEVYFDGGWRTVCKNERWDLRNANAACKQLGFQRAVYVGSSHVHTRNDRIWMKDVECNGTENSLFSCEFRNRNVEGCNHSAWIECISLRLVDSSTLSEGHVDYFLDGEWSAVCNDRWGEAEATIACKLLGFHAGVPSFKFGFENYMTAINGRSMNNCSSQTIAGVECDYIRLVNGSGNNSGLVEVHIDFHWDRVCSDCWGTKEATVVCKQLGFQGGLPSSTFEGREERIGVANIKCAGTESNLLSCSFFGWHFKICEHEKNAGVDCIDLRLVGGSDSHEGRLEVNLSDEWGTVCNRKWGIKSANVVCRQLGFPGARRGNFSFSSGKGKIWLKDIDCVGDESSITLCPSVKWKFENCTHLEDVSVKCMHVRLVNGSSSYEGRVEIFHKGEWGAVCGKRWTIQNAHVVCRQLGFPGATKLLNFSSGINRIWMDNVQCRGNEEDLTDCLFAGWGNHSCNQSYEAGVECENDSAFTPSYFPTTVSENTTVLSNRVDVPEKKRLLTTAAIISTMAGSALLIIITVLFLWMRRRRNTRAKEQETMHLELPTYRPPILQPHYYNKSKPPDSWEVVPSALSFMNVIGQGFFGVVVKGKLSEVVLSSCGEEEADSLKKSLRHKPPRTVACKLLKENARDQDVLDLLDEIKLTKSIGQNKHIVSMVGCITRTHPLCLLLEYCSDGDLLSLLKEGRKPYQHTGDIIINEDPLKNTEKFAAEVHSESVLLKDKDVSFSKVENLHQQKNENYNFCLTPANLLSFAWQIASGMEYLAGKRLVHRDLACRNVLVTEGKLLKVSDFGLTRAVHNEGKYEQKTNRLLPLRWMSIEAISDRLFTEQSDIWSFGVVVWEICTLGCFPYPPIGTKHLLNYLLKGNRLDQPENCSKELYSLMIQCWHRDPERRPSFHRLVEKLDSMVNSESPNEYIDLNFACLHVAWDANDVIEEEDKEDLLDNLSANTLLNNEKQHCARKLSETEPEVDHLEALFGETIML